MTDTHNNTAAATEGEREFAALLAQVKRQDFPEVLALLADIAAQHSSASAKP
jgi:hypothetical protein